MGRPVQRRHFDEEFRRLLRELPRAQRRATEGSASASLKVVVSVVSLRMRARAFSKNHIELYITLDWCVLYAQHRLPT